MTSQELMKATCNGCGKVLELFHVPGKSFTQQLVDKGWKFGEEDKDYCPNCHHRLPAYRETHGLDTYPKV